MDMSIIFEKLAMTTHDNPKLHQIFQQLPSHIRDAVSSSDSIKLRSLISKGAYFSDSVKVATK